MRQVMHRLPEVERLVTVADWHAIGREEAGNENAEEQGKKKAHYRRFSNAGALDGRRRRSVFMGSDMIRASMRLFLTLMHHKAGDSTQSHVGCYTFKPRCWRRRRDGN